MYIALYFCLSSTVKRKKSIRRLHIYIYIYIYITIIIIFVINILVLTIISISCLFFIINIFCHNRQYFLSPPPSLFYVTGKEFLIIIIFL